jgi:hypothetical protein
MTALNPHGREGCEDPSCGYLPDCAGNRAADRASAERKLRAIEDGTIHRCCLPRTEEEMYRLRAAAGRPTRMRQAVETFQPARGAALTRAEAERCAAGVDLLIEILRVCYRAAAAGLLELDIEDRPKPSAGAHETEPNDGATVRAELLEME